ncbi:MAG: protein kinase [Kiritimatiellia bacterium]|nr:protein kinase [Kiritimatiellia bacterium]
MEKTEKTEKQAVSIEAEHISQLSCAGCQKILDVSHLQPFIKIKCPECGTIQIVPAKFASFLLIKQLGAGGMGVIYRAMDRELGRQVALKVMKKSLGDNLEFVQAFKHEAQAAAALNHRNVVQIYSFGQYNGQPYIVMELVDGGKLEDLIAGGGLDELKALEIHLEVTEGLMAASDVGLVHGDIKPANILFGKNGEAKVVDFGLASYISEQQQGKPVWGTPYYIAPEKARGKKVDFRSDIYSLGATLFHVLTGKPPFDGPTSNDVVMVRLNKPAPDILEINPDIHPETAKMVARMLEIEPGMRYPSYPALLVDMRHALKTARKPFGRQTHISAVTIPLKVSETKIKFLIQKVTWKIALGFAAGILVIALGVAGWMNHNRQQELIKREAAERQLFTQSREAGQANWERIVNLAILIAETGTNIVPLAEKADQIAASLNRIDDSTAKVMDETDKVKEWLNESEDLWATAATLVRQLQATADSQTAARMSGQIESVFDKLISIYGSMQESGEFAKEVFAQAGELHKKAIEEARREKAEKARAEALQRKAEVAKTHVKKKEEKKKEESKKIRLITIQRELDAIDKFRGANALLIAKRKFSEAERSLDSVRSRVTLDETRAVLRNIEETYAEITKLKGWLINAINRAPCKNCWIMGRSSHDIVKANGESSITIALGSAGTTIIQWESVSVSQWIKMVNYYAESANLSDPQRAIIFKQMALFCYESGVFKTAETYANAACKANPDLLADLSRLMPDIVRSEQ